MGSSDVAAGSGGALRSAPPPPLAGEDVAAGSGGALGSAPPPPLADGDSQAITRCRSNGSAKTMDALRAGSAATVPSSLLQTVR